MTTQSRRGLRILYFEDDLRDAELLTAAVEGAIPDCTVVRVDSAGAYRRALETFRPDVILSDQGIPGFNSLDALRLAQTGRTEAPFLLVSGGFEQITADCLKAGAANFVRKSDLERLVPSMTSALKQRAPLRQLSERQRQVLRLLAAGASMQDIARQLRVSVKTIESHRAAVMKRLGFRRLTQLVRYAIRVGLVSAAE